MPEPSTGNIKEVNLFVTTRPGQIRNIASYLAQTGRKPNVLMVSTTTNEAALRENISDMLPEGIFEAVSWAIVPPNPASPLGSLRRAKVYKAFESATLEALQAVAPLPNGVHPVKVNLHVPHPSAYYRYFPDILSRHGYMKGTTILYEEGLSSYKWCTLPYELDAYGRKVEDKSQRQPARQVMSQATGRLSARSKALRMEPGLGNALSFAKALAGVGTSVVSCAIGRNFNLVLVEVKDRLLPKKLRFGILDYFDEGWFTLPEAMESATQFSFGKMERLELSVPSPSEEVMALLEDAPDVIFCNQQFGEYGLYIDAVLTALENAGVKKVFFKAHPRENNDTLEKQLSAAREKHPSIEISTIPQLNGLLTETLLLSGHFREAYGLTSTSLIYAHVLGIETKLASIAGDFGEIYAAKYKEKYGHGMHATHLRLFSRDWEVFRGLSKWLPRIDMGKEGR